ncbi:uncharacterized protein EURHEDRAFT_415912 [Aspergillus ruber CBS 135680]|uniref:Retrotransposon gag domain-containing protein n=1 Tax=Aspergillus ruber (strain CBS 135680) TaxID=1388766 RepID=A0A017S5K9_ASPRC|nr:uncharacterized protein EURHEDRAFT_415912 [Aspergillus ruber CBS 135680]EYE91919.1 hypothetical protein EURHEDRAFT_415912 [Aspergillus ruber CBS 135680]
MASQYPPTNPNSNPDKMMDLEILQLQEELTRMRKQRALLQLRSEIAKEQQLLAEAQQSLGLAELPAVPSEQPVEEQLAERLAERLPERPVFNPPPGPRLRSVPPTNPTTDDVDELIRGIKRSHSESSDFNGRNGLETVQEQRPMGQDNNGEEGQQQPPLEPISRQGSSGRERTQDELEDVEVPPTFTVKRQYRGASRKEYNLTIEFLQSHFAQYEHYYASDERKIEEGLRHVVPDIERAWDLHVVNNDRVEPTWSNFCKFLLSRIINLVDPTVARRQYYGRSQRENQTVREFSNHLGSWESNLEELLTEGQRIQNLWERVLPSVREEAMPYQYQSDRYQDHIAHLQSVESHMPSRAHMQKKIAAAAAAAAKNKHYQKYGYQQNFSRSAPKHPRAKRPRMNNPINYPMNNS